jgi:ADP-sugar diphosphatase
MTSRIHAIDNEIMKCMSQLRSMGSSQTLLGAQAPAIRLNASNPYEIFICGNPIKIVPHASLNVSKLGKAVVNEADTTEQGSWELLFQLIMKFAAFKEWCHTFDYDFFMDAGMTTISILSAQFFGSRIGFIEFSTDLKFKPYYCEQYRKRALQNGVNEDALRDPEISNIVFMRGAAVTVLVIITSESGMRYSILVVQPRAAIGKFSMAELPAGMIDDSSSFSGTAAKELKEETGITITESQLEDLTEDMGYNKVYPSCGGCDEHMKFYLYKCEMDKATLEGIQNKCTGAYKEGENIKVKIVPFDRLAEHSPDMKTLSALYLYELRCKRRAINTR